MEFYKKLTAKNAWVDGFTHHPWLSWWPVANLRRHGTDIAHHGRQPLAHRRLVHAGTAWQRQFRALRHRPGWHRHSVNVFHPDLASRICRTWMALASCPARQ